MKLLLVRLTLCTIVAGRSRLVENLKLRKLLVVIDNADNQARLKNLLPPCKLHPESLAIVTSRKRDVLEARCKSVSEVQLLPEGQ